MLATTLANRELLNFVYELKKLNASAEIVLAATMFEQLEHRVDTEDGDFIAALESELAEKENENYILRERIAELNTNKATNTSLNDFQQNLLEESLNELKEENQALKEKLFELSNTKAETELLKEVEELRKFKKVFRYLVNEVNK